MFLSDVVVISYLRLCLFRGEAIPGGKSLIEDMPLSLQQDVTYEETKDYLEKVMSIYHFISQYKHLLTHSCYNKKHKIDHIARFINN